MSQKVSQFNTLFPKNKRWIATKARKKYVDLFGDVIENGKTYYRRKDKREFKLSERSMFCLLRLVVGDSPTVLHLVCELWEEEHERLKQAHAEHSLIAQLQREGLFKKQSASRS
jgi:hypothetical protein